MPRVTLEGLGEGSTHPSPPGPGLTLEHNPEGALGSCGPQSLPGTRQPHLEAECPVVPEEWLHLLGFAFPCAKAGTRRAPHAGLWVFYCLTRMMWLGHTHM